MSDFGTMSIHGSHAAVRFERRNDAAEEEVWAALTQPACMGRARRAVGLRVARPRSGYERLRPLYEARLTGNAAS